MTTFGLARAALMDGRRSRVADRRARRQSVILAAARWLGSATPPWRKTRPWVLRLSAFGFLDYAAWSWSVTAGCVAIGVSLLVLELVSDK